MSRPGQKGTKAPAPTPAIQSKSAPKPAGPPGTRMADAAVANLKLEVCRFCKRKFAGDRIETHEAACRAQDPKAHQRPVYDAQRHRLSGTPAEGFLSKGSKGKGAKGGGGPAIKHPPNNWKQQQEAGTQQRQQERRGSKEGGKAVPGGSGTSDYIQCPYCARRFNPNAAERHIPQCKDMIHNKPTSPGGGSNNNKLVPTPLPVTATNKAAAGQKKVI